MILSPEDFTRGRATAGVPSLSDQKRAAITNRRRMANKQEGLISDAEGRKKKAGEPDGNRTRTIREASGMWLNTDEFLKRLYRLKANIFYCEPTMGFKDRISIYRLTNNPEVPKVYVGAVHKDKIPEFSVFDTEKHTVKMMGWRTVLLRLITAKIITLGAVETTFGPPGASSKNWHKLFSW